MTKTDTMCRRRESKALNQTDPIQSPDPAGGL